MDPARPERTKEDEHVDSARRAEEEDDDDHEGSHEGAKLFALRDYRSFSPSSSSSFSPFGGGGARAR
eukprot:9111900-Pyramimonas_sp.AAC.1